MFKVTIPIIFGQPLYLWIGILLGILVIFQVLVAKRWIRIPFVWHRRNGWLILCVGIIHGFLAVEAFFFNAPTKVF